MSADRADEMMRVQAIRASGEGEWIMPSVSYVDPTRRFCEFCGRPIARRFWQVATERGARVFCDPAHAGFDATYPKSSDIGSG
jgi:hypothetical protein